MNDSIFERPLSRRSMLTAAAGAAVGVSALGSAAAAADRRIRVARAGVASPTLRIAFAVDVPGASMDPASPNRTYPMDHLYDKLVHPNSRQLPEPGLATSWSANKSADVWTFKLRPGVRFHDGKPFTSEDVAYTFQHILDPATKSPAASVLGTLFDADSVKTPNAHTVVFRLKQPYADFPLALLSYSWIIPAGSGPTIGKTGIGTGPFKLDAWVQGTRMALSRNERYWAGKPQLAQVLITEINDPQAETNALVAGQVDLIADQLDFAAAKIIAGNKNLVVLEAPSGQWTTLSARTDTAPFTDRRVLEAMKLVVDPAAVIKAVLQGHGRPAGDDPVAPNDPYRLEFTRRQDVGRAKAHLAEAGHGSGLDLTLYTDAEQSMLSLGEIYQALAKKAGINVSIQNISPDVYWSQNWLKSPFTTSWWGARTADQVLNEVFRCGANWNETSWCSNQFGRTLDAARRELDFKKRRALYQKAQRLLIASSGEIIPYFVNHLFGMSKRVTGYSALPGLWWYKVGLR
jgi:peptide/nickel transport system substrate-binding protein